MLSGAFLNLAWPEVGGITIFIFIAFIPLLFIAKTYEKKNWRPLFLFSFLSFIIWHIISNYWMLYSTLLGSITAWVVNSFLMATVFVLAFISNKRFSKIPISIYLAFYWLSFEILHLFWDLSWPWMTLGNTFANNTEWVQWYEFIGIYGGTFWIIITNGLLFQLLHHIIIKQKKQLIIYGILSVLMIFIPLGISYSLLRKPISYNHEIHIGIIQSNFDTYTEKFSGLTPIQQSKSMLQQFRELPAEIDLCILPETAIPENIEETANNYPESIDLFLQESNKTNIPVLLSYYSKDSVHSYNTAALAENGIIKETRHKSKLVPFAESIPFKFITKGLKSIIQEEGGMGYTFSKDRDAHVFNLGAEQVKMGTLICFESIFSDLTSEMTRKGAEILIIITNDDWWKNTAGHRQHFAFSRLHAIQNRRPIARAANTGISGFIDAYGDVQLSSKYREKKVLHQKIKSVRTLSFFTQFERQIRYTIAIISFTLLLLSLIWPYKMNK